MNDTHRDAALQIMELERESCRRMLAGDLKWNDANILAEETLQFPPGSPVLDREGYSRWLDAFLKLEGVKFSWEPTDVVVSEGNDMAYCYGTTCFQEAGKPDRKGKYVSVWRRLDVGWRCVVEINNLSDSVD